MAERSESPRGTNGLQQLFAKNRGRDKKGRDSTSNSIKSSGSDSFSFGGSRADSDKMKKSYIEEDDGDSPSAFKKLVNKGIPSRMRRRKQGETEEDQNDSDEVARGRSIAERGTLENDSSDHPYAQRAGDASSLLTYDSDQESPPEKRPSLSTHASHAGYLTSSSPLVKTTKVADVPSSVSQLDEPAAAGPATSLSSLALANSTSKSTLTTDSLRALQGGIPKSSTSPVGKLKEALVPRGSTSPNRSPERRAVTLGIGPLSKEKVTTGENRRGSVASRIGAIFPDRQQANSTTSSTERPRNGQLQQIDTNARPATPPSADQKAPTIVNTPPTPTEPSAPRFSDSREQRTTESSKPTPNGPSSPTGNVMSHRRGRSGSATLVPSKLSNITSAPLTPTLENGGITPAPNPQTGFFSSVFSVAQNAANTLSNSMTNTSATTGNRSRSGTQEVKEPDSPVVEALLSKSEAGNPPEEKELAVKTLGMGDLSLSHLGISENSSGANTPIASRFTEDTRGRAELINENSFATNSALTGENIDNGLPVYVDDLPPLTRPRSIHDPAITGEQTPPSGSVFEGKAGVARSGSARSALGKRRKRGSSAATGNTIGAAIAAANASMGHPSGSASTPKITGFAVASKKRNRDFHGLFRSVPDDDYLIEDYSCALQKEILLHGRLYVSEGHLCFSSNIFGWVTTLVMSFDEIVSVEKRSTALLFKNGLMISTLHAKHVFASFTSRDSTYDLIVGIWKLGHPSLRSSLNGVRLDETGGDKTEKDDGNPPLGSQSGSESESDDEEGDEVYDEDDDDEDGMSFTHADGSVAGSDVGEKVISRKTSTAVVTNGASPEKSKEEALPSQVADFPGPLTHAPTDCTDQETHYAKVLVDEAIPAPLGKVYSLMFGPASLTWMRNWLTVEQKCLELTMESSKPLALDNKVRTYSYIKPLNGSIGPKQTKCVCTETLDSLDYEKAISVTISTATPDVPSGNVFSTKTKYCLSWGEGNTTRLQMNCTIEWTGKSWLKGPIEKGANDGQVQYAKDIIASLKAAVSRRTPVTTTNKGKKKGRKGREAKAHGNSVGGALDAKPAVENWGIFEPLHGILGPVVDILKPLMTGNILYGLLVGLLVASWFRFGLSGAGGRGRDVDGRGGIFMSAPLRQVAYEEIWRREESELWEWLEERVSVERLKDVGRMPAEKRGDYRTTSGFEIGSLEQRKVEEAIRVTEEKLKVLKEVVGRKREKIDKGKERNPAGVPAKPSVASEESQNKEL